MCIYLYVYGICHILINYLHFIFCCWPFFNTNLQYFTLNRIEVGVCLPLLDEAYRRKAPIQTCVASTIGNFKDWLCILRLIRWQSCMMVLLIDHIVFLMLSLKWCVATGRYMNSFIHVEEEVLRDGSVWKDATWIMKQSQMSRAFKLKGALTVQQGWRQCQRWSYIWYWSIGDFKLKIGISTHINPLRACRAAENSPKSPCCKPRPTGWRGGDLDYAPCQEPSARSWLLQDWRAFGGVRRHPQFGRSLFAMWSFPKRKDSFSVNGAEYCFIDLVLLLGIQ